MVDFRFFICKLVNLQSFHYTSTPKYLKLKLPSSVPTLTVYPKFTDFDEVDGPTDIETFLTGLCVEQSCVFLLLPFKLKTLC